MYGLTHCQAVRPSLSVMLAVKGAHGAEEAYNLQAKTTQDNTWQLTVVHLYCSCTHCRGCMHILSLHATEGRSRDVRACHAPAVPARDTVCHPDWLCSPFAMFHDCCCRPLLVVPLTSHHGCCGRVMQRQLLVKAGMCEKHCVSWA